MKLDPSDLSQPSSSPIVAYRPDGTGMTQAELDFEFNEFLKQGTPDEQASADWGFTQDPPARS